ncbi:hypothetical protein L3Q82_002837 [Scortum barcoo]|uniref:Uncharacterized protein n=1 Tax=Scortum barcoo TaxID=214431 RepID=A0ACB8VVB5_9TELE|nr:hypothetical protein L3Q82_002837 [Scortum barcoo]
MTSRSRSSLISSAFKLLQQAQVFTKLDLWNAYHLVQIREGDEWKTGFNTPTSHYEYLVMPFGFINEVLHHYLNNFVFVYLDDILIFSPDPATHQHHIRQVLTCLLENQLYVKAEKCEFRASPVSFLGFIVSANQIKMDPEKLSFAEHNYDVGNQELLAIKVTLEEWHHWLEGATIHSVDRP